MDDDRKQETDALGVEIRTPFLMKAEGGTETEAPGWVRPDSPAISALGACKGSVPGRASQAYKLN